MLKVGDTSCSATADAEQASARSAAENDMPNFTRAQLDYVVDNAIEQFVQQFGEKSGTTIDDYAVVADAAKEALPCSTDSGSFEQLYPGAEVKKIIDAVSAYCTKVLVSKLDEARRDQAQGQGAV